jgi:hypothetical protein
MTPSSPARDTQDRASSYAEFLAAKAQLDSEHGFEPTWLPDWLFDLQHNLVDWSVRMGRAALLADCGLGKSAMELVWAENVRRHTGKPVLILAPLAVSFQLLAEAEKFGVDAGISRDGSIPAGVTITNYERIERFDPYKFGGVGCDESSAIKAFDGQRRALVTELLRTNEYRLLGTATAAPNDYTELGTSSEALGYLGHMDMLSRFFTRSAQTFQTERQQWRMKGHAQEAFWRWVASWARAVRRPSDLGFSDDGYVLPELRERMHIVDVSVPADGVLFDVPAQGLHEEREEARRSLTDRCEKAAELLADAEPGIAWCHLNAESALLAKLTGGVEVSGADSIEAKEEKLSAFSHGDVRTLVIKPAVGAFGMNWQHCHRMTYFPSHSFEAAYQAIRRCWRFGQLHPVTVDYITTPGGRNVLANLQRKAAAADVMFDQLTAHMRDALTVARSETYDQKVRLPKWAA